MSRLTLGDLLDLEVRFHAEREEDRDARRARYRGLGRQAGEGGPESLLAGLARSAGGTTVGRTFESALGWLHVLLAAAGVLAGGGLALGLLDNRGPHPVNVLDALGLLVGVQLALLLALAVALVPRRRSSWAPSPGFLQALLRRVLRLFMREAEAKDLLWNLALRRQANQELERWVLVRATQIFGVAFNLAALACCLYRILFSDVAFGWSTTLQCGPAQVQHLVDLLAAPWCWLYPAGSPSLRVVEWTQYSHLEGRYLLHAAGERSAAASAVSEWWPFLVLSLLVYGLIPRALLLAAASFQIRRRLRGAPADNEEFRRVADWMSRPLVDCATEGGAEGAPAPAAGPVGDAPDLAPAGTRCPVVTAEAVPIDREILGGLVARKFGWRLAEGAAAEGPILVVLPAWEEPIRMYQRQIRSIREGAGAERLIVVALVDKSPAGAWTAPSEKTRLRWARHLHEALRDPRLRVESLGAAP